MGDWASSGSGIKRFRLPVALSIPLACANNHAVPTRSADLESLFARLCDDGVVRRLVQLARDEDLGVAGDITSRACISESAIAHAAIVAREHAVLSGVRVVPLVLQACAPDVAFQGRAADGHTVASRQTIGFLTGPTRQILAAERTLLNFIGRLAGIASLTARFVAAAHDAAKLAGLARPPKILDTRKTSPGMRALEKYAVACGGGSSHRIGLYDAALFKDNHLAGVPVSELPAFLTAAAAKARALALQPHEPGHRAPKPLAFVEAEVDSLDQLAAILAAGGCGLDIILLDNMTPDELRRAVKLRDDSALPIELEASGGISLDTMPFVAATGVDRISAGQLTHSARCIDVALDFLTET